jgi:hypothetical protein
LVVLGLMSWIGFGALHVDLTRLVTGAAALSNNREGEPVTTVAGDLDGATVYCFVEKQNLDEFAKIEITVRLRDLTSLLCNLEGSE